VNTSKWFVVTLCLVALRALVAPSAMMAHEENKATKLHLANPSRYRAKFCRLEPIGSRSPTASQIATSFRSGTQIGHGLWRQFWRFPITGCNPQEEP
jgi:hypothetical protein